MSQFQFQLLHGSDIDVAHEAVTRTPKPADLFHVPTIDCVTTCLPGARASPRALGSCPLETLGKLAWTLCGQPGDSTYRDWASRSQSWATVPEAPRRFPRNLVTVGEGPLLLQPPGSHKGVLKGETPRRD